MQGRIQILFLEDNPIDVRRVEGMLSRDPSGVDLVHVDTFENALGVLDQRRFDVILTDLHLSDSSGLDTFARLSERAGNVPIIVLTAAADHEQMAIDAVQLGAQDFLSKQDLSPSIVRRSIRYAIERHRLLSQIHNLSLLDDLTGLYNRRGFRTLTDHHLKLAKRLDTSLILFFADLDGLKSINDIHGHKAGDDAIRAMANVLRESFRDTDILARLGGDEFLALAVESSDHGPSSIMGRIDEKLATLNADGRRPYALKVSIGHLRYDLANPISLDDLLAEADRLMYARKQAKSARPSGRG